MDMSGMRSPHSLKNRIARVIWGTVWVLLFRTSPRPLRRWRNFLLRVFGAQIDKTAVIYPSTRIWGPWNLTMGKHSCLAAGVEVYCLGPIQIGNHSVVSQYTYLCGGTHDYQQPNLPLITAPIVIGDQVWVAADVFVAPGVTIGEGTVVGARSNVFTDLPPWKVCVGSPAKPIKDRVIRGAAGADPCQC
jgi:putative colanic acid biosynthesis acetyltransferase WcaF